MMWQPHGKGHGSHVVEDVASTWQMMTSTFFAAISARINFTTDPK
jgi:hypothetical protein